MPPPPTTRALPLAVLAGVLYWASQPPLGAGWVAFVALVPLLLALRECSAGRGLLLGWVAGTVACNGLTSASIYTALLRARHPAWLAGVEAAAVPQLCGAAWFALFGAYAAHVTGRLRDPAALVALSAAWVAGELARARIGHGMPWVLLAHAEADYPTLLQIADVTGAYGVSFVVAMVNVALAAACGVGRRWAPLAIASGVLLATIGYGAWRRAQPVAGTGLDVALVQGDVPSEWRTALSKLPATVAHYRGLVTRAAAPRPGLVILPENALTVSAAANPQLLAELAAPLAGTGAYLLVGGPRTVATALGRGTVRNAAYLVDQGGNLRGVYDKRHLVPFGETSTWLVPARLQEQLGLRDDYSAGDGATLLDAGGMPIGTLICWEGIYPDAAAGLVRAGARLLVNLSNDDWFGGRPAVAQHFHATLLRAVETRRPLLRVTNSGLTVAIDAHGVVVASAPRDAAVVLPARVTPGTALTPYVRFGDVFGWLCVAVTALALATTTARAGAARASGRDSGAAGRAPSPSRRTP